MAAPNKTKKKITRKAAKRYEMVSFTVDDLFEGEFVLPKFQPSLGVLASIEEGRVSALMGWLRDANVDEEYLDAIGSLDPEELQTFIAAWTEGQIATAPKSSD